ncbi:hypothetical protein [Acinetobacter junii]|uniref:hypothetical protein n=1 Tax=Acinetobacter junii TaxID=40215 RepID=UPI000F68141C|nr:hypothetical protein [Acinetobacter junii]QXR26990.1 hypothetical protein EGT69_011925 [Acinetobacter junii]
MNAIKFIQQHGVDKAREVVDGAPEGATHLSGFTGQIYKDSGDVVYVWDGAKYHKSIYEHTQGMISLSDLKRLVKGVDLVTAWGGLESTYSKFRYAQEHKNIYPANMIQQAIADYEAIGGEHV